MQLNPAKTEIVWSATSCRLHQLQSHRFVLVLTISCQPLSFEISASTLTPTSRCELMSQDRVSLFCSAGSATEHPSVSVAARSPVAHVVTCFVSTGLRQLDPGRHPSTSSSVSSIGDECSYSADFSVVEIRPRHSGSSSTPLAEGS